MTRISLALLRLYKVTLSPLFGAVSSCRYEPTCSVYAYEAIQRYGPRRGWWMALRRLARCAPWGGHGPDPVPDRYMSWSETRRLRRTQRGVTTR